MLGYSRLLNVVASELGGGWRLKLLGSQGFAKASPLLEWRGLAHVFLDTVLETIQLHFIHENQYNFTISFTHPFSFIILSVSSLCKYCGE